VSRRSGVGTVIPVGGTQPRVVVRLLGPLRIAVDERPLEVDTRKASAVLAVLAVEGPQRRDRLAALLWPDSDAVHAAGSFRRTLSVLNSALGEGVLRADRREVALVAEAVELDLARFRALVSSTTSHGHEPSGVCAACREPLAAAAALHDGDFLAGFTLRDAPEFEDWQAGWAERLRRDLRHTLDRLTRTEIDAGDLDAAIGHTQAWLAIDPLNEHVHARLMLLHGRRGERNEAIQRYRDCVAVLDRELGVRPLERTTRLYRALLEGATGRTDTEGAGPAPRSVPAKRSGPRDPRTLVGRDDDLGSAERRLRHGVTLVVRGEAGIGKTRFVEELEARLHRRGAAVLVGRCHADERSLSFGPVVDLIRAGVASAGAQQRLAGMNRTWVAEASRLVPELAEVRAPLGASEPAGAQARLLDALSRVISATLPETPLRVVILEDVHNADDATLDLVCYLAHRAEEHRLALVLTGRDDQVGSDHPLRRLAPEDDERVVVDLGRLGDAAVTTYVRAALGDRPDLPELTERIQREAEGLPLALVEYSRWLADAEPNPDGDWPIPASIRELVRSRLTALSDTARQVVTAAAIAGHDVDEDLVRRVAGRTEEETLAGLEELVERQLLRPGGSGSGFDFAHDRIRAVAYEDTNAARRRLLHARVADALAARAGARPETGSAGVIAEHARLGGRDEDAAVWSLRAGDQARTVFANAEARHHYEQALALGYPEPATLHTRIARLEVLDGDYAAALASYETAAARTSDPIALAVIEHELGALHVRRRSLSLGRIHLETALSAVDGQDAALAARIAADLGLLELTAGDVERAAPHAAMALRLAEDARDRTAVAQARNVAGLLARRRGDLTDALRHLEHAAALAATAEDPTAYIAALNNLALTTADAGDGDRAVMLLTTALERCEQQGDRHRRAALLNNLADLHHRDGDHERSMELLKLAVTQFAEVVESDHREPEIWKLTEW
jgi:DNA-binding SARP family transcriptional activator/predicted ATPase